MFGVAQPHGQGPVRAVDIEASGKNPSAFLVPVTKCLADIASDAGQAIPKHFVSINAQKQVRPTLEVKPEIDRAAWQEIRNFGPLGLVQNIRKRKQKTDQDGSENKRGLEAGKLKHEKSGKCGRPGPGTRGLLIFIVVCRLGLCAHVA